MKTADLYIRVSTEEQKMTGFSQRSQEEFLKSYCSSQSITIGQVIFEEYSAKTFNRPAWKELFTAYRTHRLPVPRLLLVTKWDRFSRNTSEAYEMLRKLSRLGVEVRAVEQAVDMSIPENNMMLAFFLAVPEVENARRSLEIRKGRNRGITEGRWMGLAPYAYKNIVDPNGIKFIEPIEMQARILRFAFQKLSTGLHTITEVFHLAVEYGFNKSKNCFWKAIRNPVYCGKIPVHRDGREILTQGQHQAIIPESLFLEVQQILRRKKVVTRSVRISDILPLRGLLLCPKCNRVMTGSGSTGKRKTIYYYYHCHPHCHIRFPVHQVHDQLECFLHGLHPDPSFEQFYQLIEQELLRQQMAKRLQAHASALRKIEVCKQRLTRLDRLLLDGAIEPDHYKPLKLDCDAEIELLQNTVKLASARLEDVQQFCKHHSPGIRRLGELHPSLNAVKKKELVSWLFPFGVVYSPNCFTQSGIAESLQIIFNKQTLPFNSKERKGAEDPFNSSDDFENSTFLHKLVEKMMNDVACLTLKQTREIARFFFKVAELSLSLEIAP
jgi:DNA invertase Pin-like site-specific DNA recombinase